MLAKVQTSYDAAYLDDIPGSRCGIEDGPWPKAYKVLDSQAIWRELATLARPQRTPLPGMRKSATAAVADSVNFQPCRGTRTQDRYVVQSLMVGGRVWTLTGVFDGHMGDLTVEHVARHLPVLIHERLRTALHACSSPLSPTYIAELLSSAITALDDALVADVLALFPGGLEGLNDMTDTDIRRIINDQYRGGKNHTKARLCMYGTTALVTLVDPDGENLWVANLGDCQAAMVLPDGCGDWNVEFLTTEQNGHNNSEIERVRREHPGEPECVLDARVLGALAPFRCLGDIPFKQPPSFTRRILYNLSPGFHNTAPWEEFLARNLTPPYISSTPEITYRRLPPSNCSFQKGYLVLCSDGFVDVCGGGPREQHRVMASWARGMEMDLEMAGNVGRPGTERQAGNMALRLLREALGGADCFRVSRVLTLDMGIPWIDDISVVVQTL